MQKPKLDLNDLEVTSFATLPGTGTIALPGPGTGLPTIIVNPGDPTAATWCYICPVRTQDCY